MRPVPPKIRVTKDPLLIGVSAGGPYTMGYCRSKKEALLLSQNHRRIGNAWDGGGPLYIHKAKLDHGPTAGYRIYVLNGGVTVHGVSIGCAYHGNIPGWRPYSYTQPYQPATQTWEGWQNALSGHYATGVSRTAPGRPEASLGQFLIELRDLPRLPFRRLLRRLRGVPFQRIPHVLRKRLRDYRSLGSEYLNIEFGWRPFVKDLQDMYYLWKVIDKRIAQIIRDNGKGIRRRTVLEEQTTVTQREASYTYPYAHVYGPGPNVQLYTPSRSLCRATLKETTKVWFAAKYSYWIPDVTSVAWNARARLALFGALPTPELLWEVLPWSWLIDWFTNIGDIVANVSEPVGAVDNLVRQYAFVMMHTRYEQVSTCHTYHGERIPTNLDPKKWSSLDHTFSTTLVDEYKMRLGGGNPFGLNVQLTSLTSRQLAILAALGISRSRVR